MVEVSGLLCGMLSVGLQVKAMVIDPSYRVYAAACI
jgi:hypothetical protein